LSKWRNSTEKVERLNEICEKRGTGEKERSKRMTIRDRWERKRNRADNETEGKERKERKKYTCERGIDKRAKKMKRERKKEKEKERERERERERRGRGFCNFVDADIAMQV